MRNSSKGSSLDILSTTSVPTEPGNICLYGYKTFMRGLQICYISWQPSIEVFFCGFPGAGAWRISFFCQARGILAQGFAHNRLRTHNEEEST